MAKRATLELNYQPKGIEFHSDHFVLFYKGNSGIISPKQHKRGFMYLDIFQSEGKPLKRLNLNKIMSEHSLELVSVKAVKFPKLAWSDRRCEETEFNKQFILKKVLIVGLCNHIGAKRPFLLKMNLESGLAESIKILTINVRITAVAFGPYDNNYFLIGLSNGTLLVFDSVSLERIHNIPLFKSPITRISMEPANMIFIASSTGGLTAISLIKKEMHYVYLDLGKKQFCTVALPKNGSKPNGEVKGGLNQDTLLIEGRQASFCCI